MRKKLLIILILTALFFVFLGLRWVYLNYLAKKQASGFVVVESSPSANVFIDDQVVGKTPLESYSLPVGKHKIKLIPEGPAKDTATWQSEFMITKDAITYISVNLGKNAATTAATIIYAEGEKNNNFFLSFFRKPKTGTVVVETDPAGAIVYLNNDEKGIAPLKLLDLPNGEHELKVSLPFFFSRTTKINVESGRVIYVKFKLALDESQKMIKLEDENKQATEEAKPKEAQVVKVRIKSTPTGWLRVRDQAGLSGKEIAKVKVNSEFELLQETADGWYKIKFNGNKEDLVSGEFTEGWISSRYAEKIEQTSSSDSTGEAEANQ